MSAFAEIEQAAKTRKPLGIVVLSPSLFSDDWADKPDADVCIGLRSLSGVDVETARGEAAVRAWELHPNEADDEVRIEAYNDALLTCLVARGTCDPNEAAGPCELWGGMAEEGVRERMTVEGIGHVYDELERVVLEHSPLRTQLDDDGIGDLSAVALEKLQTLDAVKAQRIRRLLGFVMEELGG